MIVVSPHLDDAVLSFGGHLAGSPKRATILTVLAGLPPVWSWPTPFDSKCGFRRSHDAVAMRREEDALAADLLGALPVHLAYLDGQYGIHQSPRDIALTLLELFHPADEIVVPLGLIHPDHIRVARCCRVAMAWLPEKPLTIYADLPTATTCDPQVVDGQLAQWRQAGWTLDPIEWNVDLDAKRRAWDCYASQRLLPELAFDDLGEEHGWRATHAG